MYPATSHLRGIEILTTITDLLTNIFVLVDDLYQEHGQQLLHGKVGSKPEFTDSEVITLLLAMDFMPFPSETQVFCPVLRTARRALIIVTSAYSDS
jgi:hypothetical protein